jgi:hypothetical protein
VLIENDDDPLTAEAVAHTLEQFEANSLSAILSGHPYAVQQASHATAEASANGGAAPAAAASARGLHHSATAPVHSHLLDRAAEVAAAAVAEGLTGAAPVPRTSKSGLGPLNITGAVSRANIELLPAEGPGLVPRDMTPPLSPTAAAAAAGGSGAAGSSTAGAGAPAGAAGGGSSWFLASGSSFKKGMWLEKTPMGGPAGAGGAAGTGVSSPLRLNTAPAGSPHSQQQQQPASPVLNSPLSLGAAVAVPDLGTSPQRSAFSLQLRRESQQLLPTVAEDDQQAGAAGSPWRHQQQQAEPAAAAAEGEQAAAAAGTAAAGTEAAAAVRALRRSQTTQRMSTDVLAAAGALSKGLSAFSSASQALPAMATAGELT